MTKDELDLIVERSVPVNMGMHRVVSEEDWSMMVATIERILVERHLDNADLAHAYDFARNKGESLERAAVVAWLRACAMDPEAPGAEMRWLQEHAARIERGEHIKEKP